MSETILVIDDDDLVLRSFTKLLRANGYEVISASSYDEAITAFEGKSFNLILSDIKNAGKKRR